MRIELTVSHDGRETDVAIAAAESLPFAALSDRLAEVVGLPASAVLWGGVHPVRPASRLGDGSLRTGARLCTGGPCRGGPPASVLALHQVGGPGAGRIVALGRGTVVLGRDPACDVQVDDVDVSRRHAAIEVSGSVTVRDLDSTNGTFVDGRRADHRGVLLPAQAVLRIGDSMFTVVAPSGTPAVVTPADDGSLLVLRPPRRSARLPHPNIAMPVQHVAHRPRSVQWITALVPAVAGGAIAWVSHSPQFLLFALLSPVMMVSTALGDRVHWRRSRRADAATFRRRRDDAERAVLAASAAEAVARRRESPDPAALARLVTLPASTLWERRRTDPDWLRVRIGSADLPSQVRIRTGTASEPATTVRDVPYDITLRDGPVGLAGPDAVLATIGRWLLAQVTALHSPADLACSLLLSHEAAPNWHWARWLPHMQGRVAIADDDCAALVARLTAEADVRLSQRRLDPTGWTGPWHVLVIDRSSRLAEVPGLAALLARGRTVGLTAVCLDESETGLPAGCRTTVRTTGETGSRATVHASDGTVHDGVVLDRVSAGWADAVARRLAPLVDAGTDGLAALPDSCSLLAALDRKELDVASVLAGWGADDGGAHTVLGEGTDGSVCLDLVRDGPHALVAGTTGAGKSELLQSLVAGLAATHPPDSVNFVLIDYKGGAAFGDCALLPHTAGLVTDLDAYLTERALRSLDSELRRRERLFAAANAADLDAYRSTGARLARLVIVVDEFAALAQELPAFVRGLVGVAQRGRSLGIHLVLATQRPGGAVSAEIRANTSLRIALRMTDAGESSDVIDAPDAALIDRSTPGRAFLRAGSVLTAFQTAHAGGHGVPSAGPTVTHLEQWRRSTGDDSPGDAASELTQLVAALRLAHEARGGEDARSPWFPPLPVRLSRAELPAQSPGDAPAHDRCVAVGCVDLPDDQRRDVLRLDLSAGGSLLAAGTARSGRTTLLSSLALGAAQVLAPADLHLYTIDAAGTLAAIVGLLPHSATVLGPDHLSAAPTLLRRLAQRMSDSTGAAGADPSSLLLIDGWDALAARLSDAEVMELTDTLAALHRVAAASRLTIVVTGDRTCLAPRFAGQFAAKLVLRLTDHADYALAAIAGRDIPAEMPPGRGLRGADGAAVQIAHPGDEPTTASAVATAGAVALQWAASRSRPDAVRIRPLPSAIAVSALPRRAQWTTLGVGGDGGEPVLVDLFAGDRRFLVAGPVRSGRSTALCSLMHQAIDQARPVVVAAPPRSPLTRWASECGVELLRPTDGPAQVLAHRSAYASPPVLLLVDDCETFADTPAGDTLLEWVRDQDAALAAVVAGRNDDLATTYRGLGAVVRRSNCGVLLRPGAVDGEILGVRLPRRPSTGPPGRGVVIGQPSWGALFESGDPVPVQLAVP